MLDSPAFQTLLRTEEFPVNPTANEVSNAGGDNFRLTWEDIHGIVEVRKEKGTRSCVGERMIIR